MPLFAAHRSITRVALCAGALAACRSTPRPQHQALELQPAIRVSGQSDDVDAAQPLALAVGASGMLVAWADEHHEGATGDRIFVRRLSPVGEAIGEPIEVGRGWAPSVAALDDGFIVAWEHPVDYKDPIVAYARAGQGTDAVGPVTTLDGGSISGIALGAFRDTIVAAGCDAETKNQMLVVRDLLGTRSIERIATAHGCDSVALAVLDAPPRLAITGQSVQPSSSETFTTEDPAHPFQRRSVSDEWCEAPLAVSGETVSVCSSGPPDHETVHVRTATGERALVAVDVRLRGFRAVSLANGLLIAWVVETTDGFELQTTLVEADGRAATSPVRLVPRMKTSNFSLDAAGTHAWFVYASERKIDDEDYSNDIVVVPVAVKSR